jgi:hypothetical protein
MKPIIKSAAAKFTTKQLNGVRKFLFGSKTTAKMTRMFPGILVSINIMDNEAVINDA